MKYSALIALLFLAACDDPTPEQQQKLKEALPEGCTFTDVGRYGSIDNLIIVTCDGRLTEITQTHKSQSNGKTTETDNSAVVFIR